MSWRVVLCHRLTKVIAQRALWKRVPIGPVSNAILALDRRKSMVCYITYDIVKRLVKRGPDCQVIHISSDCIVGFMSFRCEPDSVHFTMWATVPTYSSEALILSTLVLYAQSRQYHLELRKTGRPLKGSFYDQKTRSKTECVRRCIQHTDCRSLGYNKTSGTCHLYSANTANTENRGDGLMWGILRELINGSEKKMLQDTTPVPTRPIALKKGRMAWHGAYDACVRDQALLLHIDNEAKQAEAVKMANDSGLEYIAIGVFWNRGKWVNIPHTNLVYNNWAKGEPRRLCLFGVLSKKTGYKWAALSLLGEADGRLCELN